MKKWKKVSSEVLLDHPRMKITQDTVELPNGEIKEWPFWDTTDSVLIVGITEGKLIMIRQYRYLVGEEVLEFPAGGLHEGESVESGVKREFEEETGFKAGSLHKLCSVYETYGQLNRKIHMYFVSEVVKTQQHLDRGEDGYEDINVELIDLEEVINMACEDKLPAMGCGLAVLMLKQKISRGEITF